MTHLLVHKHHFHVSHEVVKLMLQQLVPEHNVAKCVAEPTTNDVWHVDGYDKLRPYGILISGYHTQHFSVLLNFLVRKHVYENRPHNSYIVQAGGLSVCHWWSL